MRVTLLLLILFMYSLSRAQTVNLVPNPGFEDITDTPTCGDQLYLCQSWFNPTDATPDLISCIAPSAAQSSCLLGSANCHRCAIGGHEAHSGNTFVGLHIINEQNWFREYASVKLNDSMRAGQLYYVEYYVGVGEAQWTIFCNPPAALFTLAPVPRTNIVLADPQIYSETILNDYSEAAWTKVSGVFRADSAFSYLTLGTFFSLTDPRMRVSTFADTVEWLSSYFVDDVKVLKLPKPELGPDRLICDNDSTVLNANVSAAGYIWSTGETARTITAKRGGMYWVGAQSAEANITLYDTMIIRTLPSPHVDLGPDTGICSDQPVYIPVSADDGILYHWSPGGEATASIIIDTFGAYAVTVENEYGCYADDTIRVYENCPDCISDLTIYPNPTHGDLTVTFRCEYDYSGVGWSLVNDIGQLCQKETVNIYKGNNEIKLYIDRAMTNNTYILSINLPCQRIRRKIEVMGGN